MSWSALTPALLDRWIDVEPVRCPLPHSAYLESGRFPSDALRDFIALTWRGKQLADTKTLAECGVPAGATLHHVTYGIAAQAPVDYHAMVKSITADHGEQDPTEFPEHWDSKWSRGDEWMTYREFAGAL